MKIKISELENRLNQKIKRNYSVIGLDCATKTGIAFLKTNEDTLFIDWTFFEINSTDEKQKYRQLYEEFQKLITDEDKAIIEEVFFGRNVRSTILLARIGTLAIAQCLNRKIPYELITALSARSKLGINTRKAEKGKSKLYVAEWLKENLNFQIDQNDIADAIVLGLLGLIENLNFQPIKTMRKKKKRKKAKRLTKR